MAKLVSKMVAQQASDKSVEIPRVFSSIFESLLGFLAGIWSSRASSWSPWALSQPHVLGKFSKDFNTFTMSHVE